MDETIIELKGVYKGYPLSKNSWKMIKELLFKSDYQKSDFNNGWVLRDINLSVSKGEAFGIVGENGAGKSTLLSIIAGIIKPTYGKCIVVGKVSSLLELGVGFHHEFSGLENIYLYGTLLGLSRSEIDSKVKTIIEFSELQESIKKPLKEYSSGMTVRLAFSVAISMEPDILIVDEALSVGDIHFQKKSLEAILKFKQNGGTILFASHSMYHVLHLCERALWLKNGEPMMLDRAFAVVEAYENYMREKDSNDVKTDTAPTATDSPVWITNALITKNGQRVSTIQTYDHIDLEINLNSKSATLIHIAVGLDRNDMVNIYATSTEMEKLNPIYVDMRKKVFFSIKNLGLLAGEYNFIIFLLDDKAFNVLYKYRTENFTVVRTTKELGIYKIDHLWRVI